MTDILQEAIQVIEERGEKYGHPRENLKRIAEMWTSYLGFSIEVQDVAMMMILLKVARTVETPMHKDSLVDIAGYVGALDKALTK